MRIRRLTIATLLTAVAWAGLAGAPARASGTTVKVDVVVAQRTSSSCGYVCTGTYEGAGVTIGGRLWRLEFQSAPIVPKGCWHYYTGTWSLTAADSSGDGLSGTMSYEDYEYTTHMTVTGGTGAYAGAVDVNPEGSEQPFAIAPVPTFGFYGCNGRLLADTWTGSFEFNLQ